MAHDNSFERQMFEFYGIDNIGQVLEELSDGCQIKEKALMQIGFDIVMKYDGISKDEMEREKNNTLGQLQGLQCPRARGLRPSHEHCATGFMCYYPEVVGEAQRTRETVRHAPSTAPSPAPTSD